MGWKRQSIIERNGVGELSVIQTALNIWQRDGKGDSGVGKAENVIFDES